MIHMCGQVLVIFVYHRNFICMEFANTFVLL